MTGVRPRTAKVGVTQTAQLGRAEPTVPQDLQPLVVAFASDRPPVGHPQQVGVMASVSVSGGPG